MNEFHPRAVAAGLALLLALAAGCGKPLPPETDAKQARDALTAALDAWKDGRPAESLRGNNPPVDFRDPQWERGGRLAVYEVTAEERAGLSVRFTVRLQLQDMDGKPRDRTTMYTVDAGQAIVIRPAF